MQRRLLREAQRYVSMRGKGPRAAPLQARHLALAGVPGHCALVARHRHRPDRRHHAALVRRDLGRRRCSSLEVLTLDHYRELLEYPEHRARHRQHARHRAHRRRRGGRLLHRDCARHPPLAVRLDALVDYLVHAAARHAGMVAGLALLWVFLFFKPLTPLRETLVSVWLAYTIVWLAYGMRLVSGTLLQVAPELEEAARSIGATDIRVKRDVTLPLIRTACWQAGCSSSSSSCASIRPASICSAPEPR